MPVVVAAAFVAAQVTGFVAGALAGAIGYFGLSAGALLAISQLAGGLAFAATDLLLRKRPGSQDVGSNRADVRNTIRVAVQPARWVLGRARVGGSLVFIGTKEHKKAPDAGSFKELWGDDTNGEFLHLALALSEGPVDAVEKIWILDEEHTITAVDAAGLATLEGPKAEHFRAFLYLDGSGNNNGAILREEFPERWTTEHQGKSIAWCHLIFRQPNYKNVDDRVWASLPQVNFLVKGLKFSRPGQATPEWSENAADAFYWWLRVRRGLPPGAIDQTAYNSASMIAGVDVMGHPRYSVNGVISSQDDPESVENELRFAMQGSAVEWNGTYILRAGADRTPVRNITHDDITDINLIRPAPALNERVNRITGAIPQSAEHDWGEWRTPEINDMPAQTRDGEVLPRDIGPRAFIAYPAAMTRLIAISLRLARAANMWDMTLRPGDNFENLMIRPGDFLTATEPITGLDDSPLYVVSTEFLSDWNIRVIARQQNAGAYADDDNLGPLDAPRGLPFDGRDIPPPNPTNLTILKFVDTGQDGSLQGVFAISVDDSPYNTIFKVTGPLADDTPETRTQRSFDEIEYFRVARLGKYKIEAWHVSSYGLLSAQPASREVELLASDKNIPDPVPQQFTQNFQIGQVTFLSIPDRSITGIQFRASIGDEDGTGTLPAITAANWNSGGELLVTTGFQDATGGQPLIGQFLIPRSGRYRLFCRVSDRWGNLSGVVEIGTHVLNIDDIGTPAKRFRELEAYLVRDIGSAAPATPGASGSFNFDTGIFTPPSGGWVGRWPGVQPGKVIYIINATANDEDAITWHAEAGDWSRPEIGLDPGDINTAYRRFTASPIAAPPNSASNVPANYVDSPGSATGSGLLYSVLGVRRPGSNVWVWSFPELAETPGLGDLDGNLPADKRPTGVFTISITASQQATLEAIMAQANPQLTPAFVAVADAATPGDNKTGDFILFTRPDFVSWWTWSGARWIFAENIIAAAQILAVNIKAITGNFNDLNVEGTLSAEHISADVQNYRLLWEDVSGVNVNSSSRTFTFPVSEDVRDFTYLSGSASRSTFYYPLWAVPVGALPSGGNGSPPSDAARVQIAGDADFVIWRSSDGRNVYMRLPSRGDSGYVYNIAGLKGQPAGMTGGGGIDPPVVQPTQVQAVAGSDRAISSGASTQIGGSDVITNGSGSTSILWTRRSGVGGSLSSSTSASPSFTAPTLNPGDAQRAIVYRKLVVNNGVSSFDDITITVLPPDAPTQVQAVAGNSRTISSGASTQIGGSDVITNGSGSTSILWTRRSGVGGSLSSSTSASPTFTAPALNPGDSARQITFRKTVTNNGVTDFQDITITVSAPGDVITTDTDYAWIQAASSPSVPTGGTGSVSHRPTGWTRTGTSTTAPFRPTSTQNVYRIQRTRTYRNGSFESATSWGSLTKTADATGGGGFDFPGTNTFVVYGNGSDTSSQNARDGAIRAVLDTNTGLIPGGQAGLRLLTADLQISTSSSFTSPTTLSDPTGANSSGIFNVNFTGLRAGVYYLRGRLRSSSETGDWKTGTRVQIFEGFDDGE